MDLFDQQREIEEMGRNKINILRADVQHMKKRDRFENRHIK